MHCVPGQRRAFYAHRKLAHTGKDLQTTKLIGLCLFIELARHHAMKFIEEHFHFLLALSLHRLRHHAGRSFRNGTTGTFKTYIFDLIVLNVEVDVELVTAQWIVAFSPAVRILELMKIPRLLVVIEDDLLI